MKTVGIFLFLFILLLLSACSVETAHAPEVELEATTTPAPTVTYAPNTAIIFKRSGGIAGLNEQWTVFTDGRIETNSPTAHQLSAGQVNQLLDSLEATGFFELNSVYLPEETCCDRFFYEITAKQGTTYHTVRTLEATPDMPEALQQSLRLLENTLLETGSN